MTFDCGAKHSDVVPREDQKRILYSARKPWSLRNRNRKFVGTCCFERWVLAPIHCIGKTMIHSFEADQLRAPGKGACQAYRIEHRLRSGVAETNLFNTRNGYGYFFSKVDFSGVRKRKHRPVRLNKVDHR